MDMWVAWISTALTFLALDSIWLSLTASRLYRPLLGPLLRENYALAPAAAFYALFTIGIVVFAVLPSLAETDWKAALARGAFFGLVGYGVYDLTNQATMRGWPPAVTLADLAWGTTLTSIAAVAGYCAARRFGAG
jgi:uncharacterized membrane protein